MADRMDQAADFAGRRMELVNSGLPDIVRAEIYSGGNPVSSGGIQLNRNKTSAALQLMGFTGAASSGSGRIIDLTEAGNVSFTLAAGSGIALNGRTVSANSEGSGIVLASLDLGGGNSLTDGVMVKRDADKEPEEPEDVDDEKPNCTVMCNLACILCNLARISNRPLVVDDA